MITLDKFFKTEPLDIIILINHLEEYELEKLEESFIKYGKTILDGVKHAIEGLNTLEEVEAVIERIKTQLI